MKKVLVLFCVIISLFLCSCQSASIGIIGGADGPTAEPKGTDLFGSFLSLCLGIFRRPFTPLNMTNLFDNDNKFKANSNSHIVGDGVLDIPIKIITEGDISHRRYIEFQRNISQIPKEFISRITG